MEGFNNRFESRNRLEGFLFKTGESLKFITLKQKFYADKTY